MAVETDDEGRALRVVFFQANEAGERRYAWVAPLGDDDDAPSLFQSTQGATAAVAHARRRRTGARALPASTGSA